MVLFGSASRPCAWFDDINYLPPYEYGYKALISLNVLFTGNVEK